MLRLAKANQFRTFALNRALGSTTYYDSQSGLQVTYTDDVKVHGLSRSGDWTGKVTELASITLSTKSELLPSSLAQLTVYIDTTSEEDLESAVVMGANCSVRLGCSSPRETWNDALALCASGRAKGMQVKATIEDSLDVDPSKLVLAAELLADSGAEIIMLQLQPGFDEDGLEEAFEALVAANSNHQTEPQQIH